MQSSAVVGLRVAVMLTCLIVAPMAAIFGSSLPKVVTSVLQGKGLPPSSRTPAAADLRAQGGEAPVFGANVQAPPSAPGAGGAPPLWPVGSVPNVQPQQPPLPLSPAAKPVGATDPVPRPTASATPVSASAPAGPQPETSQSIERRLRELGATYYLLEYQGNSSHYRFHCKMSIAGNPNLTRPFEATDTDPLRAMGQVLDQVQKWRAGTQP